MYQPLTLRRDPRIDEYQGTGVEQAESGEKRDAHRRPVISVNNGIEALAKSEMRRIVVLGSPGMGKTTALKDLLHHAIIQAQANIAAPLPIFISLPDLARSGQTIEAYLSNVVEALEADVRFAGILVEAISSGQAFLCLDSLDEVLPALRPQMIALINREALRCGGTWIIGSRFSEYKGGQFARSQFAEWELQPLDAESRLKLAQQLLTILGNTLATSHIDMANLSQPLAETFVEMVHRDAQTATWGENPLLFSLAAVAYVQMGTLPASRAVLYHEVVDAMLKQRTPDYAERQELHNLLADVALSLYQTKGRNFTRQELVALLSTDYEDWSLD